MTKYKIKKNTLNDWELDENNTAQLVERYEWTIYRRKTGCPLRTFAHDWEALEWARKHDPDNAKEY